MIEINIMIFFIIVFFAIIGCWFSGYWIANKLDKKAKRGILRTSKECRIQ